MEGLTERLGVFSKLLRRRSVHFAVGPCLIDLSSSSSSKLASKVSQGGTRESAYNTCLLHQPKFPNSRHSASEAIVSASAYLRRAHKPYLRHKQQHRRARMFRKGMICSCALLQMVHRPCYCFKGHRRDSPARCSFAKLRLSFIERNWYYLQTKASGVYQC